MFQSLLLATSSCCAEAFRPPAIPLLTTDPQNQNWVYGSEPTADVVRTVDGRQRQMVGLLRVDGGAPHRWLGDCSLAPTAALGPTRTEHNVDLACDLLTYETLGGVGQAGHDTCNRLCYADRRCLAYTTSDSRANPGHVYCALKNCTDQFIPLKRHNPVVYILTGPRQPEVSCPPAARTLAVHVGPTYTSFVMTAADVQLNVSLATTMFTDDHVRLSRPAFYVNYEVTSLNGEPHDVDLYLDVSAQAAVAEPQSTVSWNDWPTTVGGLRGVRMGASRQRVLSGPMVSDNMISWGFLHAAVPADDPSAGVQAGSVSTSRQTFLQDGHLPRIPDERKPRATFTDLPGLCTVFRNITASGSTVSKRTAMLGYDDVQAIDYFGQHLPGLWTTEYNGSIAKAMSAAYSERQAMSAKTTAFEAQLTSDLRVAGGERYAQLGILSYRQGLAATKLVWNAECNCTWNFLKEINSCGDMSTVDVVFPTSPLLLYSDPALLRMLLLPVLYYANNGTYVNFTDPFSPHQLGVYPVGNSTTADQELMPLENTGNMFLMLLGIVQQDPAHDTSFFYPQYWPMLVGWADELASTVQYPANQICTDDFTGPLANNTNLGAKGVIALEAFAQLCVRAGAEAGGGTNCSAYSRMAAEFAMTWQQHAYTDKPQPHYKMSFNDVPGIVDSWSLKYNLLWQRLLRMGDRPFPLEKTIAPREVAYYKRQLEGHAYGTPLDPRHNYTKSDWLSWAAALSASDEDFQLLFDPIWRYANETQQRHPLADLYNTIDAPGLDGKPWMYARPVVGAFFARALDKKNQIRAIPRTPRITTAYSVPIEK